MIDAVAALSSAANHPDWVSVSEVDVPLHHITILNGIDDASYQHLFFHYSLALPCSLPRAGDWLNVVPSPSLGLHLHYKEFCSCLRYWLGVLLHISAHWYPDCGGSADVFGNHQVGCGVNGDRITQHNAVQEILYTAAQAAALGPIKEAQRLSNSSVKVFRSLGDVSEGAGLEHVNYFW